MNMRKWAGWVVLVAAAITGAKFLQADDEPAPLPLSPQRVVPHLPPADIEPIAENETSNPGPPRRFSPPAAPKLPSAAPSRPDGPVVIEMPPDSVRSGRSRLTRREARPTLPARASHDDKIVPTGVFVSTKSHEPSESVEEDLSKQSEQRVTVEWVGPGQVKIGQPFIYELVVRNEGDSPVADVIVRDRMPPDMRIVSLEPQGVQDSDVYEWNLGSLEPRDERRIRIEMVAGQKGDVTCHATVTATTEALAAFRVCEPMLAVKQTAPEKVMVGEPVAVNISVTNPGDGPADEVVLRTVLTEGLRHEKGNDFTFEIGSLAAGETRVVQIVCATVAGGEQSIATTATGAGGLEANAHATSQVTEPKLAIIVDGPGLRYLDRHATYTLRVSNPGDAVAENVKVSASMPSGFKFAAASNGGRHDYSASSIAWMIGSIPPGETREVSYKCQAVQSGQHRHAAVVQGSKNLKAEAEVITRVEGISALLLEVVDIDDPVEVGTETAYEIRVTNQGSSEATNIEIHALAPTEMTIRGGQGPTKHRVEGQEILFTPLPKLAPRADAIYRVFVIGSGKGDVRFRARLISDSLSEPVIEEESTKVYDD